MNRVSLWRASLMMVALTAIACGQETGSKSPQAGALASQEADVVLSQPNALILESTVTGGLNSVEAAAAIAAGLTPILVNDTQWAGMTAEDFASYQLIILGDASCANLSAVSAAVANRHVWGPAINGNIFIAGTAPVGNGAPSSVTEKAVRFAGVSWGMTGLYASLSCYYQNAEPNTHVALLEPFGDFSVQSGGCHPTTHIVSMDDELAELDDGMMSNWDCSVNAQFNSFPMGDFAPWAVAAYPTGSRGVGVKEFYDGTIGAPYILARGAQLLGCGNYQEDAGEQCDFGKESNGIAGMECSATCQLSWCGNGVVDEGEDCDLGAFNGEGVCPKSCRTLPPPPPPSHRPPVASCKHVSLSAGPTCGGVSASINDGSSDPDGDLVNCVQSVTSFETGTAMATLTCTDAQGLSASCTGSVTVLDDIAPTISCPAASTFECGQGSAQLTPADAQDNCTTPSVTYSMEGESFALGTSRPVTWTANDGFNEAACSTSITMVDTLAPSLSLHGASLKQLECGVSTYSEEGAQASDACSGDLSSRVAISGDVNAASVGSYPVSYSVTDEAGHLSTAVRTVNVADTKAPVLALNGAGTLALECNVGQYTEAGATAVDACAGNLSNKVAISGTVDRSVRGTYPVSYSVKDASGNVASAVRAVSVNDTLAPVLSLAGAATMKLECNVNAFIEPGVTAVDVCSGNLSSAIVKTGSVNDKAVGTYSLRYDVKDAANLLASAVRTVQVEDTQAPTLTMTGSSTMTMECGVGQYLEPGVTASDVCTGDVTGRITTTGSVNRSVRGAYPLTYRVTDVSNNAASVVRTVNVTDTKAPVISLVGAASMTVNRGTAFTDPGATATDACSGTLTSSIVKTGSVNTSVVGTYTLHYTVKDAVNLSATVARTVTVAEACNTSVTVKPVQKIWPPNHNYQSFSLSDCAAVTSSCGTGGGCHGGADIDSMGTILSIYSDEVEDASGNGDGNTDDDIVITGESTFKLRAERQGKGNGRVYGIRFRVTDSSGASQTATCKFAVPHDQGDTNVVDNGAAAGYTVNAPAW